MVILRIWIAEVEEVVERNSYNAQRIAVELFSRLNLDLRLVSQRVDNVAQKVRKQLEGKKLEAEKEVSYGYYGQTIGNFIAPRVGESFGTDRGYISGVVVPEFINQLIRQDIKTWGRYTPSHDYADFLRKRWNVGKGKEIPDNLENAVRKIVTIYLCHNTAN